MHFISKKILALLRATRLCLHLAYGLMVAIIYPKLKSSQQQYILQIWSAELLRILNVHVNTAGLSKLNFLHPGLIVTNHISWLDVFVLNAISPMRFVAKSEVKAWPIIGWFCAQTKTLFIARGKASDAARINTRMTELLNKGENLAVFPEGTTTNGKSVARFHSSLLQAAIDAHVQVKPIAIRYEDQLGSLSNAAAYIDDVSLLTSIWSILCCDGLHVRLQATSPLDTLKVGRRNLAQTAQKNIEAALDLMHVTPTTPCNQNKKKSDETKADLHFQSLYCVLLHSPRSK